VTTLLRGAHVIAAQLFINEQRAKAVDFIPLFYMGYGAVVRADDVRFTGITNVAALNNSQFTIVVSTGEAADPWVHANLPQANIKRIAVESSDNTRFLHEVLSGRADIGIAGMDVTDEFVAAHSGEVRNLFAEPFGLVQAGWAVKKQDHQWRDLLKSQLDSLAERGVLHRLEEKYHIRVVHK
jgi:ABC-type amino acid transport substrate-binding protein